MSRLRVLLNISYPLLQIEDVTSDYSEQFCGKQSDVEWTTLGNTAILRFRTDGSINYAGFQAEIKPKQRNLEGMRVIIYWLMTENFIL